MVKVSDAIKASFDILKDNITSARFEAELIAGHVLNKDKLQLLICKNDEIDEKYLNKIKALSSLRTDNMPLAYITGKKEFMSLEFMVNKNVLIPRPETEELISIVIDYCQDKDVKILDLCTGSGVICCSLAHFLPKAYCVGADISTAALDIAKENAKALKLTDKTKFFVHDVLNPEFGTQKFDILVSNPPYIKSDEINHLEDTVKSFEPLIALDGGSDGLVFYKKIIQNIDLYLKKGGMLFFEIGYNQGEALKDLMSKKFTDVKIIKDLSGHNRIALGQLA